MMRTTAGSHILELVDYDSGMAYKVTLTLTLTLALALTLTLTLTLTRTLTLTLNPIRHCAMISPGSTWVALWNAIGELDGALNAGMLSQNKRCLCEDTSKEYALDDAPEYDLYSLRGEC